jgi:hypothetical protein
VAGGVNAAREGRLAGEPEVVDLVPARGVVRSGGRATERVARPIPVRVVRRVAKVGRRVHALDLDPRLGDEAATSLGPALECRIEALAAPSVLVLLPAAVVGHGAQSAGKTDAAATGLAACKVQEGPIMFGLLRRFVVGWLLIRLFRRLTGNRRR